MKLSIVYFCYGLELYLELFCHMIHCLLVDICSDDMMHYYTCISNILQNLNKFVKNNMNIWFLFFDFRPSYFQATGEGNIAPAKRGKRAQFLFIL